MDCMLQMRTCPHWCPEVAHSRAVGPVGGQVEKLCKQFVRDGGIIVESDSYVHKVLQDDASSARGVRNTLV